MRQTFAAMLTSSGSTDSGHAHRSMQLCGFGSSDLIAASETDAKSTLQTRSLYRTASIISYDPSSIPLTTADIKQRWRI